MLKSDFRVTKIVTNFSTLNFDLKRTSLLIKKQNLKIMNQ